MEEKEPNIERIKKIIAEFKKWTLHPDKTLLGFVTNSRINEIMAELQNNPEDLSLLKILDSLLEALKGFPLDLNLWKSQNIYFKLCEKLQSEMQEKVKSRDPLAQDWMELMKKTGHHLNVKCL